MSLRRVNRRASAPALEGGSGLRGSSTCERLMLLELAADLQSWPVRNIVFEEALDRAARDLARLASETPGH